MQAVLQSAIYDMCMFDWLFVASLLASSCAVLKLPAYYSCVEQHA